MYLNIALDSCGIGEIHGLRDMDNHGSIYQETRHLCENMLAHHAWYYKKSPETP